MFAKPRKERRGNGKPCTLSPPLFFCCPFNLSKKKREMDSKELNKEDMKMSRGKSERGVFSFPAE